MGGVFKWYAVTLCIDKVKNTPPQSANTQYQTASTFGMKQKPRIYSPVAGIVPRSVGSVMNICLILLCTVASITAQPYTPPASHRADIILDSGWQFIRQDVPDAQSASFNDSTWTTLNLPHTWNNLDGQNGVKDYYRGVGWYRRHYTVDKNLKGRHFFLKFDGASSVADVYVNGNHLGEHQGGFSAFAFDVTPYLKVGSGNVIAVKVSNDANTNLPPLSADFTFFGGLYRDVHLLATDPVQISPLDYGSPGIYLKTTSVSFNSANLQVTAVLLNSTAMAQIVTVRSVVTDAATNIVAVLTNVVTLPPAIASNIVASTTIARPHLWNGLSDPYLYQTFTEVWKGSKVVDVVAQPLGFRYFSVDANKGFFLNGRHYDLHGVSMHQDWPDCGWAITDAQRDTNFVLLKEIGVTALRLSHYEHDDYTYQLADKNGIVLWTEIPLVNRITESPAFYASAKQQLIELIRQRYNHPSVACWGIFNEITLKPGPKPVNLARQLAQLAAQEDTTRPSTSAVNASDDEPSNWCTELNSFNKYFGWYNGKLGELGAWADEIHAKYPNRRLGISEYGAGASIYQHSEDPVREPAQASHYHPEEYQNLFHETYWQEMRARPFLWCKFVWNMFDFAVAGRNEGDTPGRNDKGLVTYDRQVRKDAFYWYKANWTTNPMVYITGHTFTNRLTNTITAKVYANCDSVELFLNGISQGSCTSTNCIFIWPVKLLGGTNVVQAIGTKGNVKVSDSLVWIAPFLPPVAAIISPAASIVYLNSTNDTSQLSATVSNTVPNNSLTTMWIQLSGPGSVTFGRTNALGTIASFSANGIYGLAFNANNGGVTSVDLTVVVGPDFGVTNGLLTWWKMDEAGGTTAADSSGNGLNAVVNGAVFNTGYFSNALYFNGTTSVATFASPDTSSQVTLAAWVRSEGQGNSAYPHILDTPGYRLFFRFDSQGTNGFDFATCTTTRNGDWFSGVNTISHGAWHHIAVRYDPNNLPNPPTLFINGVRLPPETITTPSGSVPTGAGTGYIGNKSGLSRAWKGAIADVRIYNRLLSDAEIHTLASVPPGGVGLIASTKVIQSEQLSTMANPTRSPHPPSGFEERSGNNNPFNPATTLK
jgi:beta-galactosidase